MTDSAARRANEESVRQFFEAWDPAWPWILILGMGELRSNPGGLGELASGEADGHAGWAEESYTYGPLSLGITAGVLGIRADAQSARSSTSVMVAGRSRLIGSGRSS